MKLKNLAGIFIIGILTVALGGCGLSDEIISTQVVESITLKDYVVANIATTIIENSILDTADMFSNRDLEQEVDLTDAIYMDLESNKTVTINEEGIYVSTERLIIRRLLSKQKMMQKSNWL